MTSRSVHLLVIDPQNDFCDLPPAYCPADPTRGGEPLRPALPVPGAHADMLRLAELIDSAGAALTAITVTLDSHHRVDIGHPTFWRRGDGEAVAPFTPITATDVRGGRFLPRAQEALPRVLAYLDALEAKGRYTHMVWPVHCEIGTWGHNVHADLRRAYNGWEERTLGAVHKLIKGTNPWTEHYSAVRAEVPDPADAATQDNTAFIARLAAADRVFIGGEAGSHCVKATTEDLVEALGAAAAGKLVLLTDCMSPVAGFEAQYDRFLAEMRARGLETATSAAAVAELAAGTPRRTKGRAT